tara:strand:+ start:1431 stop:2396 length:966 start_codon:yes stop_codon:yes gene_type:complete
MSPENFALIVKNKLLWEKMATLNEQKKLMSIALFGALAISFAPMLYLFSGKNPLTGAFFRMFYALPLLGIIILISKKHDPRTSKTRLFAFFAGMILAIDFVSYHSAIDWIGTGIATLIGNSQVIIVTLISWWLLNEKPNRSILISLPIVMLGLALISGIWDENPYGESPLKGVIAGVSAAFFYSGFLLMYRYSNRSLAPSANLQFDATSGAVFGLLILGFLPLQPLLIEPIDFQPSWPSHAWLILLAAICQTLGWIAISYSLPRLPGAHTSFAILLQPVLTIIWGILFLSESPSLQQSFGMILILGSIIGVTIFGSIDEKS